MGLRSQFGTDRKAEREGKWFEIEAAKNKDGTVPGFKMARMSANNPAYQAAMERLYKEHGFSIENDTLGNETARPIILKVFADTVLLDWRNVQPNDDGVNQPFTQENVIALMDDMPDLYEVLAKEAKKLGNFQARELEAAVGKSLPPSEQNSETQEL